LLRSAPTYVGFECATLLGRFTAAAFDSSIGVARIYKLEDATLFAQHIAESLVAGCRAGNIERGPCI